MTSDLERFGEQIEAMARRLREPDRRVVPSDQADDLELALEELEVAREELIAGGEALEANLAHAAELDRRYAQLFTTAPVALITTDEAGVVREANPLAADLLALRPGQRRRTAVPAHVHADHRRSLRTALADLAPGTTTSLTMPLVADDDGSRIVHLRITALDPHTRLWVLHPADDAIATITRRHRAVLALTRQLAAALATDVDVVDFLTTTCEGAVEVLDVHAAGIILTDGGDIGVAACSGPDARLVEDVALLTKEGPCVEAAQTGARVIVDDVARTTDRWPYFAEACAEVGIAAAAAHPLHEGDQVIGAMALFRRTRVGFDDLDLAALGELAAMAALGIVTRHRLDTLEAKVGHLTYALESRIVIEQAKGMVAEQLGMHIDQAFERLRRHARSTHRKLHDLAAEVVAGHVRAHDLG